jgi:Fur family ferric uptake transcriptional regulator
VVSPRRLAPFARSSAYDARVSISKDTVEDALRGFEEFLRTKRLKMTEQRRMMIGSALEQDGHFTAEDLHRKLSRAGEPVSMATVYRGLALLEEADLLQGHDFADGLRRYERALDREHHDHMICLDCRAVVEFTNSEIERLQEEVVTEHGFTMNDHALTLFVRCNELAQSGACERRKAREARKQAERA